MSDDWTETFVSLCEPLGKLIRPQRIKAKISKVFGLIKGAGSHL